MYVKNTFDPFCEVKNRSERFILESLIRAQFGAVKIGPWPRWEPDVIPLY